MKTPKRTHCDIYKCDKCGGYGITYNADDTTCALFQCTLCGAQWHMPFLPKRTLAIRARWKRKNREARLKHALQRQAWNAVMLAADFRCAELSASSWKKRYREIWRMQFWTTSTYGQDIEGS